MAQQTSVTLGGGQGGSIREDLANFVSNIDRDETPMISSIGKTKATSVQHSWLTDEYADPIAQTVAEGEAFNPSGGTVAGGTDSMHTNRTRLSNYTQIFRAEIEVSGTSVAVNTAGIANEFAYQLKKKGVEVRRNAEYQFGRYDTSNGFGASGATRRAGGIYAFMPIANTVNRGTGAVVANTGDADNTDVPQWASTGAGTIDRDSVEAVVTAMYGNGGKPNILMMAHQLKPSFSSLFSLGDGSSSFSQRRLDAMESKLNIAVSGVITDFGFDLGLAPNYVFAHNGSYNVSGDLGHAVLYDSSMMKSAVLRPLHTTKLDDNGDGKRGLVIEECTLEVMNPNGVGGIFNLKR